MSTQSCLTNLCISFCSCWIRRSSWRCYSVPKIERKGLEARRLSKSSFGVVWSVTLWHIWFSLEDLILSNPFFFFKSVFWLDINMWRFSDRVSRESESKVWSSLLVHISRMPTPTWRQCNLIHYTNNSTINPDFMKVVAFEKCWVNFFLFFAFERCSLCCC